MVAPILSATLPTLPYAAALIGSGSEVLGYDDAQSTDHHWGPRAMLFLRADDFAAIAPTLTAIMTERLPRTFRGFPTGYHPSPGEEDTGVLLLGERGPFIHRVEVFTLRQFVINTLAFDSETETLTPAHWLAFGEQKLLEMTAGAVFRDDSGDLTAARAQFAYYPHDVWLYMMACQWQRLAQEEPFLGRTGDVGDELGSRILAARLIRDLMRLCFLQARRYAPYAKWFGTAFARLPAAALLTPHFHAALNATTWRAREAALAPAYTFLAEAHNALDLTPPLPATLAPFHSRPYQIIHSDNFASALVAAISDPAVRAIATRTAIGSLDQFSDNTDLLENMGLRAFLRGVYGR